jgi:hypothetical protein
MTADAGVCARRFAIGAAVAWFSIALVTLGATSGAWEPTNGPYGGHVHDLIVTATGAIFAGVQVEHSSYYDPDNGAYRSDDGGRSWRRVDIPQIDRPVEGLAYSGGKLYTLDRERMAVSGDDGQSWRGGPTPWGRPVVASDETLFVGSAEWDGALWGNVGILLRSTDGGANWANVFSMATEGRVMSAVFHGADLYIGTTAGLFRSSDRGGSWTGALSEGAVTAILSTPQGVTIAEWETGVLSAADPATAWDDTYLDPRFQYVTGFATYGGNAMSPPADRTRTNLAHRRRRSRLRRPNPTVRRFWTPETPQSA